jgi:hypothetical protein
MGSSYGADISQWSRSQATTLSIDGCGNVICTNPELRPYNFDPDNHGVAEDSGAVAYFALDLG